MAEGKKSFILYVDQKEVWEALSDDEAGKLIKHIIKYVNDENPTIENPLLNMAFLPIKSALKRDLKRWEEKQQQRIEAGRRSAELRKRKPTTINDRQHPSTVNVSVTVNDNVTVTVNVIEKNNKYLPIFERVIILFNDVEERYHPKTEKQINDCLDTIRLMIEVDKRNEDDIFNLIKFARTDQFWKNQVRTISALRNKNASGIMKHDSIFDKMPKQNHKQKPINDGKERKEYMYKGDPVWYTHTLEESEAYMKRFGTSIRSQRDVYKRV